MQIEKTNLEGVLLIKPDVFEDFRGQYVMVFNRREYLSPSGSVIQEGYFVEDCVSTSHKGVLRGIHADFACHKLMSVLHGEIYYVVVDCLESSPTFGKWQSFILSDKNHYQIYKPAKYGAGFLALTDDVVFHYKQSAFYDPKRQVTFLWNDPRFNIFWPVKDPILSERDISGHF